VCGWGFISTMKFKSCIFVLKSSRENRNFRERKPSHFSFIFVYESSRKVLFGARKFLTKVYEKAPKKHDCELLFPGVLPCSRRVLNPASTFENLRALFENSLRTFWEPWELFENSLRTLQLHTRTFSGNFTRTTVNTFGLLNLTLFQQ
jgi:hypothetical protein